MWQLLPRMMALDPFVGCATSKSVSWRLELLRLKKWPHAARLSRGRMVAAFDQKLWFIFSFVYLHSIDQMKEYSW
jgi:hypothetical protein